LAALSVRVSVPMAEDTSSESAVHDFLAILEEHKKNCERAGKYVEADIAKKRLEELRQHEENRRDENLRSRQIAQRLGIEEAHMLEFQQFNSMWDRTMKEYEDRASELLEAMRQRHAMDMQEFRTKHATPNSLKYSPKLLDLRRSERSLAKQGEYGQAQKLKLQADALEAAETERALVEREQQLTKLENGMVQRQDQEVNALRQRIQTGAEEQRVARQQDLERLLRRYHNIKAELESQQSAERLRQRKGTAALPGALGARIGTGSRVSLSMDPRVQSTSPSSHACLTDAPQPSPRSTRHPTSRSSSSRPGSALGSVTSRGVVR